MGYLFTGRPTAHHKTIISLFSGGHRLTGMKMFKPVTVSSGRLHQLQLSSVCGAAKEKATSIRRHAHGTMRSLDDEAFSADHMGTDKSSKKAYSVGR